jgi:hypothetical protein
VTKTYNYIRFSVGKLILELWNDIFHARFTIFKPNLIIFAVPVASETLRFVWFHRYQRALQCFFYETLTGSALPDRKQKRNRDDHPKKEKSNSALVHISCLWITLLLSKPINQRKRKVDCSFIHEILHDMRKLDNFEGELYWREKLRRVC